MKSSTLPRAPRTIAAAATLAAAAVAGAQADNTNAATDPTHDDAWHGVHPPPTTPCWRDRGRHRRPQRYFAAVMNCPKRSHQTITVV